MTLSATAGTEVEATAREVLEFVMDLRRYKEVDPKIVRVVSVDGPDEEGNGSVRMWGRMHWLPPAPDRQDFKLERWHRLTFTGAAGQPARLIFDFVGTVDCQTTANNTTAVTHAYQFRFKGPFRFLERRLSPWLQSQIDGEMTDLARRFNT